MSNPRLRRLMGRRAAMRYPTAAPGAQFLSYAGAQSINADGYTFQDDDATPVGWGTSQANNYDPVGDPKTIFVARPGFTAAGAATTVVDAVTAMSRYRQAHPNSGLWEAPAGGEVKSTLSDQVFSTDSVYDAAGALGLTNNSAVAYPDPACIWRHADLRWITGDSLDVGLYVSHAFARNGRPVAAVKFIVSDGVNADVEVTVSSMTTVTHASGLKAPWFTATVDVSTLDDGDLTVDYIVYPWCGPAYQASVDGDGARSIAQGVQTVMHDASDTYGYGRAHAMVDPVGGSDGTGAVYASEAAMAAGYAGDATTAYATINAAISGLAAYLNANYARPNWHDHATTAYDAATDCGGGTVHLQEQIDAKAAWPRQQTMDYPVEIRGVDGSTRANVVIQSGDGGSSSLQRVPTKLRLKDLTLEKIAAANDITFDGEAATSNYGADRCLIFENVAAALAGGASVYDGVVYRWHRAYAVECDGDYLDLLSRVNSNDIGVCVVVGSENWLPQQRLYGCAGSKQVRQATPVQAYEPISSEPWPAGPMVYGHSIIGRSSDGIAFDVGKTNLDGIHVPCSIIEKQIDGSNAAMYVNADSDLNAVANVLLICTTVAGQRLNFLYNDTGAAPVAKQGSLRFCITGDTYNSKDDTFAASPDGGRWDGNGTVQYRVNFRANAHLGGDAQGDDTPAPGNTWLGEVAALGDVFGSSGAPLDPAWTSDRSATGDGAGDGDYTPGVGHQLPAVPAGLAPYPIDMKGRAIPNDGTGVAGALQRAA